MHSHTSIHTGSYTHTHTSGFLVPAIIYITFSEQAQQTPITGNLGNAPPGDPSGSHDLLYSGCTEMTMGREEEKIVI